MSHHEWFERKLAHIAKVVERGSDRAFDRLVDRIEKVATLYDKLFGWLPDVDRSPMAVALGGSADALGQDTVARADLRGDLADYGAVSVGVGRARFEARAEDGPLNPQRLAFAEASSLVEGADFVVTLDRTVTGRNWETASHSYLAIDLAAVELDEPILYEVEVERQVRRARDVAEGNLADADVDVDARAESTLVDVDVDILAVEDTLSGSSVEAVLAIG